MSLTRNSLVFLGIHIYIYRRDFSSFDAMHLHLKSQTCILNYLTSLGFYSTLYSNYVNQNINIYICIVHIHIYIYVYKVTTINPLNNIVEEKLDILPLHYFTQTLQKVHLSNFIIDLTYFEYPHPDDGWINSSCS